jgi:Rrf2 family protein
MANPLRLSEAANLAVHSCAVLAASEGRISAGRLAGMMDVSPSHLAKVLQRLAGEGILESARGAAGGFRLARPADSVSLLDLVETVDGPLEGGGCLLGKPMCGRASCLFTDLMDRSADLLRKRLETTTLADFAGEMPEFSCE